MLSFSLFYEILTFIAFVQLMVCIITLLETKIKKKNIDNQANEQTNKNRTLCEN